MRENSMYSPLYTMQWFYKAIQKYDIDVESQAMLTEGHKCYDDYYYPSYIER